jgi:hypothetical protein
MREEVLLSSRLGCLRQVSVLVEDLALRHDLPCRVANRVACSLIRWCVTHSPKRSLIFLRDSQHLDLLTLLRKRGFDSLNLSDSLSLSSEQSLKRFSFLVVCQNFVVWVHIGLCEGIFGLFLATSLEWLRASQVSVKDARTWHLALRHNCSRNTHRRARWICSNLGQWARWLSILSFYFL